MDEHVATWRLLFAQRGLGMFQAAHDALLEYGGLQVTRQGLPERVDAQYPFDLNPELLMQEVWKVGSAELVLGYSLYPLGKVYHEAGASHLYIDEQGGVYFFEEAALVFVAPCLREALGCFILGRWPVHPPPGPPRTKKSFPRSDTTPPRPEDLYVIRILRRVGWYPGRRMEKQVETWRLLFESRGLHMFQAARDALLEYGGLKVTGKDLYEVRGNHRYYSFDLNPELLIGQEKLLTSDRDGLEYTMYPIGELDCPCPPLFIEEQGGIYVFVPEPVLVAPSLREALGQFILGK